MMLIINFSSRQNSYVEFCATFTTFGSTLVAPAVPEIISEKSDSFVSSQMNSVVES